MWKRLTITLLAAAIAAWIALAIASHNRRSETHTTYRIEHKPPAGWNAAPRQPSTLFLYVVPGVATIISGTVSHVRVKDDDIKLKTTDELANSLFLAARNTKPPAVAQRLQEIRVGDSTYEVVRRDRLDRAVVTAVCVKDGTTLMVTLAGRPKEVDLNISTFRQFIAQITWVEDKAAS